MKRGILLLLLALLTFSCIQPKVENFNGVEWISIDKSVQDTNQWICFKKHIEIDQVPTNAEISIAVDSKYWMWINGELAVFEGQLKRGPNRKDTYYDTVDIAPFLKKGDNTIAILVWFFGKGGFNHDDSGTPGLFVSGKIGKQKLVTDNTWKAMPHPAYGTSDLPHPNWRLPESNIRFDANKDIEDWFSPKYDDSKWPEAVVMGTFPCEPWNNLVKRPFPNWKDMGLTPYDSVYVETSEDAVTVVGVLPKNLSITPYLKVKAPAGKLIDIRTDNYMFGKNVRSCNVRAEYITKEGVQEFEAFAYMNGHTMRYTLPKDVEVVEVMYRETRFNTSYEGKFECDDPFLNILWQKCINTMNLNMRDCIQDPDRERAQWWGDAVIVLGEILYSCDQAGRDLIKKAIYNLADWQRPDSILFSPCPAGSTRKELPGQMLASIGKYGFWYYYYHTGDKATIEHVYPAVKRYMGLWELDCKNLVTHRKGDWDWHDWGSDIDTRMLDNIWYYLALEGTANMADLLGYSEDAKECKEKMALVKEAVNKHFWTGNIYRSPEYKKGHTDDRANGMAVVAGFTDEQKWEEIRKFLNTQFRAGPYIEKFIQEAYFKNNDALGGLARMKKRYKEMVESHYTTLWEYWSPTGSINHGWAGGPMVIMAEYIAGIRPTSVGWKTFIVAPQLGYLKNVSCSVPTTEGNIHVNISDGKQGYSVKVNSESKRSFEILIPRDKLTRQVIVNGKTYPVSLLNKIKTGDLVYDHSDKLGYYFKACSNLAHVIAL